MLRTSCILLSYYGIWVENGSLQHSDWSAGLTDRSRAIVRSSTPGGSSESINGEDGHGQGTLICQISCWNYNIKLRLKVLSFSYIF